MSEPVEPEFCGEDLGREYPPHTCRRTPGHNTVCSHARDRTTHAFSDAWAEYFAEHPEVQAVWGHQNGYWPQGALGEESWTAEHVPLIATEGLPHA